MNQVSIRDTQRSTEKLRMPGTLTAGLGVTATGNDDAEDRQNRSNSNKIKNKMYGTRLQFIQTIILLDNTTSIIIIGVSSRYICTALKYQIYSLTGGFKVLLT